MAQTKHFDAAIQNPDQFLAALRIARRMTTRNLKIALQQKAAMHAWAVAAYTQALNERKSVR